MKKKKVNIATMGYHVWSRVMSIKTETKTERETENKAVEFQRNVRMYSTLPGTIFHLLDAILGDPLGEPRQKVEVREFRQSDTKAVREETVNRQRNGH